MKVLIWVLCATLAWADDALVIFVKGEVQLIDLDGKSRTLSKGDKLKEGQAIKTGDDSIALLKIEGHSNHRVEENSEIMVEDLPYRFKDSKELEQGASVIIKAGSIFSEITSKAEIPTYKVKTRNTVMGIRGTTLMAAVDQQTDDVYLAVKSGVVEVENSNSGMRDYISKNQTMVIEKDKVPTKPRAAQWAKDLHWNITKPEFEKRKSFFKVREQARREHIEKKRPWVRNELEFSKVESKVRLNEIKWIERTQKLETSPQRIERKEEVIENLQTIKPHFRDVILKDQAPEVKAAFDNKTTTISRTTVENLKKTIAPESPRTKLLNTVNQTTTTGVNTRAPLPTKTVTPVENVRDRIQNPIVKPVTDPTRTISPDKIKSDLKNRLKQ